MVTFVRGEGVNEGVNEGANEGANRPYQVIMEKPGVRLPELSNTLRIPIKTLERWIKQLRDEKKVVFKGAVKTGGYYVADSHE
ncbi:MAG: hypothetical protein V2B20_21700 [Pseudomonadota bacterium]